VDADLMASNWSRHLPIVSVPQGAKPKPVTFVVPYYEAPRFLRHQLHWWSTFPEWLRAQITAVIVDDGSPKSPAVDALKGARSPFRLRLFRITPDVPWNWLAARNIGMRAAEPGWCVLTDMDHVVPQSTAEALIYGQHDPSVIYAFSRIEHTGERIQPHSASFFMTTDMFWKVGGYDEALSGHYGSDGDWRKRCSRAATMQVLADRLIRYEYQEDSSTTRYKRKLPKDTEAVRRIVAARTPGWTPKVLSFPYAEVSL
jgi:hypothetical protein